MKLRMRVWDLNQEQSRVQVLKRHPRVHHFPSYKSCLWWGLERLECESVTVMEVSCQTGRQVAATQGWSAPWHAKRPGLWHAVLSNRLWRQAGWRWGDKNQRLSGGKTQGQDVMFTMSTRRHHLWFCCTETAVNTVSAWHWWMGVYIACWGWGDSVCARMCVCVASLKPTAADLKCFHT